MLAWGMRFELKAHTHLVVIAGSRAHGTQRPDSDVDLRGFAIPPAPFFLGFLHRFEQADDEAEMRAFADDLRPEERAIAAKTTLEGSIYNLVKFVRLAADANPNIFEALFCRDEEVRRITPIGEALRAQRHLFVSARAQHTFSGYAMSQLKRIRGHRRWLLTPPEHQPRREDFGLPERTLIPADQLAAAEAAIRKKLDGWEIDYGQLSPSQVLKLESQVSRVLAEIEMGADERWHAAGRLIGLDDSLIAVLERERKYKSALADWRQFLNWKTHRNPKRAELEAEHGYDTKHGAHLVRLLRMGREIVETGEVQVWRNDAEELLQIRAGAWSYERLVDWAEGEQKALQQLRREGGVAVPPQPDLEALDRLVCELVERSLSAAP